MRRSALALLPGALSALLGVSSCRGGDMGTRSPTAPSSEAAGGVPDNAALFRLITQTEPFARYTLFPNADEFTDGRLNGSEAHRPTVRVSLNARAFAALQDGRLPAGAQFPTGSVIFKEVRPRADAPTTTYAVMYKDAGHPLAGDGWLWAEFSPDGAVGYSVSNRGAACTGCHRREQGPRNDLVRTIERQR